ncbi:NADH dehydrogenase (ubiquinone) 30 kDa subunit [Desulfovibrio sp. X2]|uniref:NADH-quinone oxidoreductase subunit C n=1 Tax=Desulfovibrio sp. X2 TaxID=941449 RepID=UPI000358B69C|nr:NADH-quinone oxidoreductase subunit C [Desulfovibrio sp. X2]EPR37393.1 NADH dehydrogenase (ubiquinone) 30 kDa subunit [Desulfovibrio sp. X2]
MATVRTLDPELEHGLEILALKGGFHWTEDQTGNRFYWYRLEVSDDLTRAAELLAAHAARLCTVTAYDPVREHGYTRHEIAYHFDCRGTMVTVTVPLSERTRSVPSITPLFRNADWNEREFMEMYGISVIGHPDPRRLFLDESLDRGIMNRIIPISVLMNGASSKDLWERILGDRHAEEKVEEAQTEGEGAAVPASEEEKA